MILATVRIQASLSSASQWKGRTGHGGAGAFCVAVRQALLAFPRNKAYQPSRRDGWLSSGADSGLVWMGSSAAASCFTNTAISVHGTCDGAAVGKRERTQAAQIQNSDRVWCLAPPALRCRNNSIALTAVAFW